MYGEVAVAKGVGDTPGVTGSVSAGACAMVDERKDSCAVVSVDEMQPNAADAI